MKSKSRLMKDSRNWLKKRKSKLNPNAPSSQTYLIVDIGLLESFGRLRWSFKEKGLSGLMLRWKKRKN